MISAAVDEIFEVADFLASAANSREAYVRSAVSRYYYSAYTSARAVESKVKADKTYSAMGAHMRVINKLLDYDGPDKSLFVKIGTELRRLKAVRSRADYNFENPVTTRTLIESKERAQRIIELCAMAHRKL